MTRPRLKGIPPEMGARLILSVGTHKKRRPLTPVEVAGCIQQCLDAGTETKELVEILHLEGETMIRRFLALLDLPPEVRHIVDWGHSDTTVSFTSAFQISRLPAEDQILVAQGALEHRLSAAELKQLVQLRSRSTRPILDCLSEIVGLRPRVVRIHVIVGAIDFDLRLGLESMTQARRDEVGGRALSRAYPQLRMAGRFGVERFTITADETCARAILQPDAEAFQGVVNEALRTEIGQHQESAG